ncbi:MAG: type II toxin-antitoxin system prevent-host-death family antitoxin [Chloroflexi bacterium]|nr:type II toxin-antitoxin system prevent-host-death family antitoxin [Chloroflexota bacterium]
MKSVSVTGAKNSLNALLEGVRRGETVLITHYGKPVARIEPHNMAELTVDEAAAALVQRGVADPPRTVLDVDRLFGASVPDLAEGFSASRTVTAERDEGL